MKLLIQILGILFCSTLNSKAQVFDTSQLISRPSVNLPQKAISTDVDNDGRIDLVVAGVKPDNLCWFRNLGNGIYGDKQSILIAEDNYTYTCSVLSNDIDNDGDNDLIAFDYQFSIGPFGNDLPFNRKCYWLENLSNGNFGEKQIINVDTTMLTRFNCKFNLVDFDGDGLKDLVYGYQSTWNKNLGGGNWSIYQPIIFNGNFFATDNYYLNDIDQDGVSEIITENSYGSGINIYAGKHDGNGQIEEILIIANGFWGIDDIELSDIDNDGLNDFVFSVNNKLIWQKNLGNGTFADTSLIYQGNSSSSSINYEIICSDFNHDGFNDIAFCGEKIYLFINNANDQFGSPSFYSSIGQKLITADLNNDDLIDIIGINEEFGFVTAKKYSLLDQFHSIEHIVLDGLNPKPNVSDFDSDGDLDIYFSDGWYECLNTNPLQYSRFKNIVDSLNWPIGGGIAGVYDFNNDGIKDFLINPPNQNDSLIILINDLSECPNVYSYIPLNISTRINSFLEIDFDLDGLNDFILSAYSLDSLNITSLFFKKNNSGLFVITQFETELNSIQTNLFLKSYDINNDNKIDILQSSQQGLLCYINQGNGLFNSPILITNESVQDFYLSDINGDGNVDLLFSSDCCSGFVVNICWGNGSIEFSSSEFIFNTEFGSGFNLQDFDLDGDPDLLISRIYLTDNESIGSEFVYFENINGELTNLTISGSIGSSVVLEADLDNDLDLDLITHNKDNTRSIYINKTNQILSASNLNTKPKINLYPNPVISDIIIDLDRIEEFVNIEVYSIEGKFIRDYKFKKLRYVTFDFNLKAGAYYLKVNTNDYTISKSIIKL